MKKATLFLLVLLVGVLVWLQRQRTRQDEAIQEGLVHVYDHALLEAFDPKRVSGVWIDNLERAEQMKFERGADGVWFMVDPVPWPARSDLFVRPTLADGDASSVREALALGVPVVASDVGHRPPGIALFRRGDLDGLVEAIAGALRGRAPAGVRTSDPGDALRRLLETYRAVRGA